MEDGTTIEQQMFTMATEKKVPLYGVLELLPLCNLNCDMCYVRMSREEMEQVGRLRTMEEWTKTAEDMIKAGTLFVLLTGGEPLLYPHFRELYQKLRELGMIITINTNGTLINEAWADFFAENKPRRINITLYGASNETYERLCHYPGGPKRAADSLLRHNLISVIASDAHSPLQRTPYMMDVYEELSREYSENHLDVLFQYNPARICDNREILRLEPVPYSGR